MAAFDPRTGDMDSKFSPSPTRSVKALVAGSEGLWLGGEFLKVNNTNQRGIALVDLKTGSLKKSDAVTYPVIDLAASSSQIFIAGGGPGGRAAAFNRNTASKQWEIKSDGNFQAVDVDDGRYVYFGGHYESIEGADAIDRLSRHEKATGKNDLSWLPIVNGIRSINAIDVTQDGLYVGGDFTKVDRKNHEGFAILPGLTK